MICVLQLFMFQWTLRVHSLTCSAILYSYHVIGRIGPPLLKHSFPTTGRLNKYSDFEFLAYTRKNKPLLQF